MLGILSSTDTLYILPMQPNVWIHPEMIFRRCASKVGWNSHEWDGIVLPWPKTLWHPHQNYYCTHVKKMVLCIRALRVLLKTKVRYGYSYQDVLTVGVLLIPTSNFRDKSRLGDILSRFRQAGTRMSGIINLYLESKRKVGESRSHVELPDITPKYKQLAQLPCGRLRACN